MMIFSAHFRIFFRMALPSLHQLTPAASIIISFCWASADLLLFHLKDTDLLLYLALETLVEAIIAN
jgi:hypothetical protein